MKNYKITLQPQDVTVTAGDIKDTDVIEIAKSIPVLTSFGASKPCEWYFCDETGNILEEVVLDEVGGTIDRSVYKIPKDLSYDNENNQAKDYYIVGVVGEKTEGVILEKSRIVKITVNPGSYKVSFQEGLFAEWVSGDDSIVVSVNSERKINEADIPSIENLKPLGEGVSFVGWSIDEVNVVDLAEMKFDKNTTLFPIWQFVIKFDANGGSFSNGKNVLEFLTSYDDFETYDSIMNIENPMRDGYSFLGFYTEKTGGKSLESYIEGEDDIIDGSLTFYAQWKESSSTVEAIQQPEDNNNTIANNVNNTNTTNIKNPQTSDNIFFFIGILFISLFGVIVTSKYKKYCNKK